MIYRSTIISHIRQIHVYSHLILPNFAIFLLYLDSYFVEVEKWVLERVEILCMALLGWDKERLLYIIDLKHFFLKVLLEQPSHWEQVGKKKTITRIYWQWKVAMEANETKSWGIMKLRQVSPALRHFPSGVYRNPGRDCPKARLNAGCGSW